MSCIVVVGSGGSYVYLANLGGQLVRLKTRGPLYGRCNICGAYDKLCEDHVPPKGVNSAKVVDLQRMLSVDGTNKSNRRFWNGIKWRTICRGCNNGILGGLHDQTLKRFALDVRQQIMSQMVLPDTVHVSSRPGSIARAIAGHILAIGVNDYIDSPLHSALSEFVLNEDKPFHDAFEFYYWLYPFNKHVLVKKCVINPNFGRGGNSLVSSILKFAPLAFMITWDRPSSIKIPFVRLNDFAIGAGMHEARLPIWNDQIPNENYPEAPTRKSAVLHGDLSFSGYQRSGKFTGWK